MKQLTTSRRYITRYALSAMVLALLSPFILHGRIAPLSMTHAAGVGTATGTYTIKLSDYPSLSSVGGSVRLTRPEQLALNPDHNAHHATGKNFPIALTRVTKTGRDAFSAVSTYCGPSCDGGAVEYRESTQEFVAETGSAAFKADGTPAVKTDIPVTGGLRTFPAIYNPDAGTVTLQNVASLKVNESDEAPSKLFLDQNYPNPFNPTTMIRYGLPSGSNVKLSIHSLLGNQIKVVLDGWQDPGNYTYDFSAQDLPSGVYFYRLQTDLGTLTRRMTVSK